MDPVTRAEALARVTTARRGHLATVRPDGTPHVVVVTFAVIDDHVVTAIDHKPKTTPRLQRLLNVESGSSASFLVDHYEDDWDRLWWVRLDGATKIYDEGDLRSQALGALADKYPQYALRQPEGPVIAVSIENVRWWASKP